MAVRGNVNIAKQFVDAPTTTTGGKGQRIYWDEKIRGFALRVGNKHKAVHWVTTGHWPQRRNARAVWRQP